MSQEENNIMEKEKEKITYKKNRNSDEKRPDFGIIEDHSGWSLDNVIDLYNIETKEMDSNTERNVDQACIQNGYFIHFGTNNCEDYYKGALTGISNWTKEKIGFIFKYICKSNNIVIRKYNRHITENLNEGDKLPKDYEYKHTIKPNRIFTYIKNGKKLKGFIVNSKDFLKPSINK